ncbi:SCO family protein [Alsobacter sp. R-9]
MAGLLSRRGLVGSLLALAGSAAAAPSFASSLHGDRPTGVDLSPLFRLTTHRGEKLARQVIRGRPFIVLFGYTNCPEVCPTALNDLSAHLASIGEGADRLAVLWVTVDPERDTVDHINTYLQAFDSRIVGLTGSVEDVKSVADAFGAPFRRGNVVSSTSYSMDHSYMMFVMDRYGLLARTVGYTEPSQKLADLSKKLLLQ